MFTKLVILLQSTLALGANPSPQPVRLISGRAEAVTPTCIGGTSQCFKITNVDLLERCPHGYRHESSVVNGAGQQIADKCVADCTAEEQAACLARDCEPARQRSQGNPSYGNYCMNSLDKCAGAQALPASSCTNKAAAAYFPANYEPWLYHLQKWLLYPPQGGGLERETQDTKQLPEYV